MKILKIIPILCCSIVFGENRSKPPVIIECGNEQKTIFSNERSDLGYGGDTLHTLELNIGNRFSFVSRQSGHGEDFLMILINKINCYEKIMEGRPIFYKENNKLIMHWFDIEAGFNWNGLRIYNIVGDSLNLEYDVSPESWGPMEPKWVDKNKVLFYKTIVNKKWKKEGDQYYLKEKYELNFINGKWTLSPG